MYSYKKVILILFLMILSSNQMVFAQRYGISSSNITPKDVLVAAIIVIILFIMVGMISYYQIKKRNQ